MLIVFSISLLGHALVHRLFSSVARDFAFSQQSARTFSIANLVVISFLTASVASPALLWLFIGILLITLKFFPVILRFFLLRRMQNALIPFLDSVILGLQTGKSFRSSCRLAVDAQTGWVKIQLHEVIESLAGSEHSVAAKSLLVKSFIDDLKFVDQSQSRCVEQLRALRAHHKMMESFRRRSGQVTQQIKMQAIIVTALYLALFVFVIRHFGFAAHKNLILGSAAAFVIGLLVIFHFGRRLKWTV